MAHKTVEKRVALLDRGPQNVDSWIDEIANKSILDLLTFPAAGIAHFRNMQTANLDLAHQQKIAQEDILVAERIVRRKQGQQTGREMDDDILGIAPPQSLVRGEEDPHPVPLSGQALVDRILMITEDYAAMDEYGVTSAADLARSRRRIVAGHAKADGFEYQTLDGLVAVMNTFEDRIGIGRVWADAMSVIVAIGLAGRRQQGDDSVPLDWELMMVMRAANTLTLV